MRRPRLFALAALAAALLAPASAQAALDWHDADRGDAIPATVTLNDVVRTPAGELIAVGKDTVTTTGEDGTTATTVHPTIYRLVGGTWTADPLTSAGATIEGELVEVAANATTVWAVGTQGADAAPLLVKRVTPALGSATPAWQQPPDDQVTKVMGKPLSVSLTDSAGYVGDDRGQLWPLSANGTIGSDPIETARAAAVNGVALAGDGTAVAVTAGTSTDARIFNVSPAAPLAGPAPAVPDAAGESLVAVARRDAGALAVDAAGVWTIQNGAWQRSAAGLGEAPQLADVSLGPAVQALAGRSGANGYVWRRGGDGQAWTRTKVVDGAGLNGVAAAGSQDVWAVGDGGVVQRYHDPCAETDCGGGGSGGGGGSNGGGGETGGGGGETGGGSSGGGSGSGGGDPPPTGNAGTNTTTTTVPPAKQGDPTVYVVEPTKPGARKRPAKRRARPRLVDRVKVLRRPRRLIVTFRLRAPARIAVSARRGRALVSHLRSRTMRPGRRRVVLPFKGKPPTQLRIVVRPLRAKRA